MEISRSFSQRPILQEATKWFKYFIPSTNRKFGGTARSFCFMVTDGWFGMTLIEFNVDSVASRQFPRRRRGRDVEVGGVATWTPQVGDGAVAGLV